MKTLLLKLLKLLFRSQRIALPTVLWIGLFVGMLALTLQLSTPIITMPGDTQIRYLIATR